MGSAPAGHGHRAVPPDHRGCPPDASSAQPVPTEADKRPHDPQRQADREDRETMPINIDHVFASRTHVYQ
jgi:hypothetical protein